MDEDLKRFIEGEKIYRCELKLAHNVADGVPIRDQMIARHGVVCTTKCAKRPVDFPLPGACNQMELIAKAFDRLIVSKSERRKSL